MRLSVDSRMARRLEPVRAFDGGHEEPIIRHSRKAAIVSFCCDRASRFNESASKYVSRIEYCASSSETHLDGLAIVLNPVR
jgi:hypothetical protein